MLDRYHYHQSAGVVLATFDDLAPELSDDEKAWFCIDDLWPLTIWHQNLVTMRWHGFVLMTFDLWRFGTRT